MATQGLVVAISAVQTLMSTHARLSTHPRMLQKFE